MGRTPRGKSFGTSVPFAKADRGLGLVFGYAIICKIAGEDYVDTQRHHIPEESMLSEAASFMEHTRVGGEMHRKEEQADGSKKIIKRGQVIFAWPMTEEIAKAMGVETNISGLMVGWKPDESCRDEILSKVEDGTYSGFSIGGKVFRTTPMPEQGGE